MALIIDLKPFEKILIGTAVIANDKSRTRLHISGEAAILREKDILKYEEADTLCKKVYFMIQTMYLARNPKMYHKGYFDLVKSVQAAAPSTAFFFLNINENIIAGRYYKALKEATSLIDHEKELIESAGLQRSLTTAS
ncbi:MAG: flagellar biosynthesis repressor FlbT [Micavibrio sp.]|nr:flagellar biosynthesis repressor FlbT [Micavibrio sp.]HCK32520.1 flagellar biosynthesis repressor FlbT [Rhodospirillaceae bacterium]|tara:strand:- start:465 stop:878 length:414 start_codon:yes stop_codon:yes gene_type:complete